MASTSLLILFPWNSVPFMVSPMSGHHHQEKSNLLDFSYAARPEREQLSGEQEAQHNKGQGIPNEEVPPAATPRRTANRRRKREEAGPISRRPQAGLPQPKNKRAEEAELRRALELSRQGMQQGFMEDKQAKGRVDMDDAEQEMIRQAIDASLTDM